MSDVEQQIDFTCHICGAQCNSAPQLSARPICETCCTDHEFEFDHFDRNHYCIHCGIMRQYDYDD